MITPWQSSLDDKVKPYFYFLKLYHNCFCFCFFQKKPTKNSNLFQTLSTVYRIKSRFLPTFGGYGARVSFSLANTSSSFLSLASVPRTFILLSSTGLAPSHFADINLGEQPHIHRGAVWTWESKGSHTGQLLASLCLSSRQESHDNNRTKLLGCCED